jgi:glutathione S-transferase
MKLYVCWTTIQLPRPPRGHPCHNAHAALKKAGYDPEVIKVRGLGMPGLPHIVTDGRREVERISGQRTVPVLVTDDGEVITESQRIVEWAERTPAAAAAEA